MSDERCDLLPNDSNQTCLTQGVGRDRACPACRREGWPAPEPDERDRELADLRNRLEAATAALHRYTCNGCKECLKGHSGPGALKEQLRRAREKGQ